MLFGIFSQRRRRPAPARKAPRTGLGLESLEGRVLPSASPLPALNPPATAAAVASPAPAVTLAASKSHSSDDHGGDDSGGLPNHIALPPGTTQVQQVSLNGTSQTFALTSSGNLDELTGTSWTVRDRAVQSFAVGTGSQGSTLYDLNKGGVLKSSTDGSHWTVQATGIKSFSVTEHNGSTEITEVSRNGGVKQVDDGGSSSHSSSNAQFEVGTKGGSTETQSKSKSKSKSKTGPEPEPTPKPQPTPTPEPEPSPGKHDS